MDDRAMPLPRESNFVSLVLSLRILPSDKAPQYQNKESSFRTCRSVLNIKISCLKKHFIRTHIPSKFAVGLEQYFPLFSFLFLSFFLSLKIESSYLPKTDFLLS